MKLKYNAYEEADRLINKKDYQINNLKIREITSVPPYTFAKLTGNGKVASAFSKCRPNDKFDQTIGQSIAISRALSKLT